MWLHYHEREGQLDYQPTAGIEDKALQARGVKNNLVHPHFSMHRAHAWRTATSDRQGSR